MPDFLNKLYWENRYRQGDTPWATRGWTPALIEYLADKPRHSSILIPGAGTSMEVLQLLEMGFTHITLCDISQSALDTIRELMAAYPDSDKVSYVHGDFFELSGAYDYIMEQTFFCALPPVMRKDYVDKMYDLLAEGGTLFGVLFGIEFDKQGPPFGGGENEYKTLFSKNFYIKEMSMCRNSIPPRMGSELFFICKKLVNPQH
jgi:SAM-dependent methyltransferase